MTDFPPVPAPPAPTVHDGVPITGPAAADYIDPPAPETPLFTLDGRPVHLRYGLGALRLLEAKFGSVPAAFRLIDQAAQAMQSPDAQSRADVFTVVTDAVVCGLWHVKVTARSGVTDAVGQVRLSDAPDVALEHLDEVPLNQLIVDLQRALTAAFGDTPATTRDELEARLCTVARVYLDAVLNTQVLSLRRLIIAETEQFPDLARRYYEQAPAGGIDVIRDSLEPYADAGLLAVRDLRVAAAHFAYLVLAPAQDRALFIPSELPSDNERELFVVTAVQAFLDAYGATGK